MRDIENKQASKETNQITVHLERPLWYQEQERVD